ncbi:hypothetical protein GJ496_002101 [Pomphorhynchus laevis]|nr:hypothetical protein GJ496_002101 [Pomphorhynchus laevis]
MEDIDLSLDDIMSKKQYTRGRRGRGANFRGTMRKNRFNNAASNIVGSSQRRWKHDLFENDVALNENSGNRLSSKLLISNLEYGVSDGDLKELFEDFGPMRKLAVHYDRSGRSCGTAEVVFESIGDAISAMQQYNGVLLDGRPMIIQLLPNQVPTMQHRNIQIASLPTILGPVRSLSRFTSGNWRNRSTFRDGVRGGNNGGGGRQSRRSFRGRNATNSSRGSMGGSRRGFANRGGANQQRNLADFSSTYLDNQLDEYKSLKINSFSSELKPLQNILQGKNSLHPDNSVVTNSGISGNNNSNLPFTVPTFMPDSAPITIGTIAHL